MRTNDMEVLGIDKKLQDEYLTRISLDQLEQLLKANTSLNKTHGCLTVMVRFSVFRFEAMRTCYWLIHIKSICGQGFSFNIIRKKCKAPSNRAKCTKCKAQIDARDWRIELVSASEIVTGQGGRPITDIKHNIECFIDWPIGSSIFIQKHTGQFGPEFSFDQFRLESRDRFGLPLFLYF